MPALLITINNEKRGAILEATPDKVIVLGRDEECEVSMPEATGVSRRHCSITYINAGFELKDLGSTNGTYADAVKLEDKTILREGVKYTIGNAEFQVIGLNLVTTPESEANNEKAKDAPTPKKEEQKRDKPAELGGALVPRTKKEIATRAGHQTPSSVYAGRLGTPRRKLCFHYSGIDYILLRGSCLVQLHHLRQPPAPFYEVSEPLLSRYSKHTTGTNIWRPTHHVCKNALFFSRYETVPQKACAVIFRLQKSRGSNQTPSFCKREATGSPITLSRSPWKDSMMRSPCSWMA